MRVVAEYLNPLEAFRCAVMVRIMEPPVIGCAIIEEYNKRTESILDSIWMDLYNLDTDMTLTRSMLSYGDRRLPAIAVRRVVSSILRTVDYILRLSSPIIIFSRNDHQIIEKIRDLSWNPIMEPCSWESVCHLVARMRRTSLCMTQNIPNRCQHILPDLDRQCMLFARPRNLFCRHHRWSHDSVFVIPAVRFKKLND